MSELSKRPQIKAFGRRKKSDLLSFSREKESRQRKSDTFQCINNITAIKNYESFLAYLFHEKGKYKSSFAHFSFKKSGKLFGTLFSRKRCVLLKRVRGELFYKKVLPV